MHGNFKRYYTLREGVVEDRLSLLQREWFKDKRFLDIGCNEADFTLAIASSFRPRSVLGIDLDPVLIATALKKREMMIARLQNNAFRSLLPRTHRQLTDYFSKDVLFQRMDIMDPSSLPLHSFDVISCLSVVKWIHLHHGDEGLLQLFALIYDLLTENGILIFEYQTWQSYKNSRNTSKVAKANFDLIQLRPEHFETTLVSTQFTVLARHYTEVQSNVLRRPLLILRKSPPRRVRHEDLGAE